MRRLSPRAIERAIYPVGFYRTKAPPVQAVKREVATEDHELLLRLWRSGGQGLLHSHARGYLG